jgi:hypothetical protein
MEVVAGTTSSTPAQVGFQAISSSTSEMFYANNWVFENGVWRARRQNAKAGSTISIG